MECDKKHLMKKFEINFNALIENKDNLYKFKII